MKKLLMIILALTLTTPALIHAESFGPQHDKIVSFFQGETEPNALDAVWDSKSVFKIGVIDDGKARTAMRTMPVKSSTMRAFVAKVSR